jgi:CIC family chloride channel protein
MPDKTQTGSILTRIKHYPGERVGRARMPEHTFMVVVAVVIGVFGGFGAILFRLAIRVFQRVFFGSWHYSLDYLLQLPWYYKLFAPAAGGLIIGPIVYHLAREARGHGVPEVMESIVMRGGAIRARVMFAKIAASAVCIGSGGSVGREGPIVQIGSALGSTFGQLLRVKGSRLRTLVACGTAAGIAATFNAPIAGALFAMEVILSDFGISQFSPIVVSSVTATVVSRHFLGDFPAFVIPQYNLISIFEMIPYALLGGIAAFVALAFITVLYKAEDLFEKVPGPGFIKPVVGGIMVGTIGIAYPHIFGVGYDTISLALENQLMWYILLLLVFLKMLATSVTIGSGGSGGVFAPSLFLGACLGGLVGTLVHTLFPAITATSGAYALVGMGAVAAGAMHAPITAIIIIFELTNDYRIILPLMIACIISVLITSRLKRDSIYTLKLSRRGINLSKGQEINVLSSLPVSSVMETDSETVNARTPFRQLVDLTVHSPHASFFVIDEQERLMGAISVHDVRRLIYESDGLGPIVVAHDLMNPLRDVFTPNDTLDTVMRAFGDMNIEELPVVEDKQTRRFIGVVSKNNVIEAYNQAIFKRDMISSMSTHLRMLSEFKRVNLPNGQELSEVEIPGEFVGQTLEKLQLRRRFGLEVLLINQNYDSEKKQWGNVMAAKPDYRFKHGDTIVVMGAQGSIEELLAMG